ncbi:hypothetical protein GGS23DRAFT_164020 [Durotheca rogersii]|uniref:uncharacterized protein n=1 Tax=Durotheca rogersii TaxID=419775 RepID=UPI00221F4C14|nr:uncharacterized protein GGS23DRAFT_164020 [Durotheca rogersii]KAI5867163.1 hypothetical protein GGS23DRAFT_164020 [Durotheca rogersii]
MHATTILVSFLGASTVTAAPIWPKVNWDAAKTDGYDTVSEYFNMLAQKVAVGKLLSIAPVCDLSKAKMPAAPEPLTPPSPGLTLSHVAIGRGTQNYTCDTANPTAAPVLAGAVATLFNASCVASTYPDLLNMLPKLAMQFNLTTREGSPMGPTNLIVSGTHFFTNNTTPFFNLDTEQYKIGEAGCAKDSQTPAPSDAPVGQLGEPAVPWLRLKTREGATGNLQEVYRLETVGGSAPATCEGMPATFERQYAAQYWFWRSQ